MRTVFALALLAAAIPCPAHAEPSWVQIAESDDQTVYIDTSSIRRTGSTLQFWSARRFTSDDGEWEQDVTLMEADCDLRRTRNIQRVVYQEDGKTESEPPAGSWHYTIAHSIGDALLSFACRY